MELIKSPFFYYHILVIAKRGRRTKMIFVGVCVCVYVSVCYQNPKYLMKQRKFNETLTWILIELSEMQHWMDIWNQLTFKVNLIQDGCHNNKHNKGYISANFTNVDLKCNVVVVEGHSQQILWVWHLGKLLVMFEVGPKQLHLHRFSAQDDLSLKPWHERWIPSKNARSSFFSVLAGLQLGCLCDRIMNQSLPHLNTIYSSYIILHCVIVSTTIFGISSAFISSANCSERCLNNQPTWLRCSVN